MTARRLTWLLAVLLAIPLVALSLAALVAGTEAGTRWLVDTVRPRLPAALHLGDVHGSLLAGVTLDSVGWEDDRASVSVRPVTVNLELLPLLNRQVRINRLTAGDAEVRIRPSQEDSDGGPVNIDLPVSIRVDEFRSAAIRVVVGDVDRRIERIAAAAGLSGNRLRIRQFDLESDWLDVSLAGSLRVAGRYAADLTADWSAVLAGESWSGRLAVSGNVSSYTIDHELSAPLALVSHGSVALDGDAPRFDLRHEWQRIARLVADRPIESTDGVLLTEGTLDDLQLDLGATVTAEPLQNADLRLLASTDLRSLQISSLQIRSALGDADATGTIGWSGTPTVQVQASLRGIDASMLSPRLSGSANADGSADLQLPDSGIRGDVVIESLGGSVLDRELSGSGRFELDGSAVDIAAADVTLGSNRVTATGRIADTLDISGTVDLQSLAELDARAAGTVSGSVTLTGPLDSPAATAQLALDAPGWDGVTAVDGSIDLRRDRSGNVDATVNLNGLRRGNIEIAETRLRASGNPDDHTVTLRATRDDALLETELAGSLSDSTWSSRVAQLSIETGALGRWVLEEPVDLSVGAQSTSVSRLCLASSNALGFACLEGRYAGGEGDFDVAVEKLPLAALPLSLPAGASATGFVEGTATGTVAGNTVNAEGTLRLVNAVITAVYEDEPYELAFTTASVDANVADNRLRSSLTVAINDGAGTMNARLTVDNVFDRASGISGTGEMLVPDTEIVAVFVPDISEPEGSVSGSLDVAGTLSAPAFRGEIVLRDAAFGVRPAGIRITDLDLTLSQLEPGRLQLDGSAKSGDGDIRIDGSTTVGLETGLRAEIDVAGSNFRLLRLPDWELSASPDIHIVLDDSTAAVTGSLAIPSADITVNSVPETAVRPSGDVTVHGEQRQETSRQRRIDIDVDASLGDDVQLSGFGLTTGISGSVRVRGGTGEPFTGSGTLSLSGGRYKAYGQDLEIESGDLIFNGPLENPQLNVRAVRRIESASVVAGIRLTGTPRRLRSEVYSEPPMGDAEALSYLLTGRALSSTGSDEEDSDFLNKAAFALGLSRAGSIASQISGDLGLDTLSVEGGADSGRIVAGKQFGERLLVEYGYGIVDKLGTLLLRYQLTNRLVLESRAGTVSELDLVYSVKKK